MVLQMLLGVLLGAGRFALRALNLVGLALVMGETQPLLAFAQHFVNTYLEPVLGALWDLHVMVQYSM